ncbi:MAG: mechanosensitive ion channel family protein [Candidatus Marsarchaeota archaeon]|nr:mechanosensitive ion channel family protein [Candidatus Marsarchaeota archaeon]
MNKFKRNLLAGIIILIFGAVLVHALIAYKFIPNSYVFYINIAFTLIFSIIVIEIVARGLVLAGSKAFKGEGSALADLFRVLAYAIVIITVLYELKINVTGILVGAGFLGIVLGLAAQNTLGNILAGFEIMAARPFKIGDRVKITTWQYSNIASTWPHGHLVPGFEGKIEKVGLVYSSLIGTDNVRTYVPNGILIQAAIINYERSETMQIRQRVELPVAKSFDDFKSRMEKSLKSAPAPIRKQIGAFSIQITDVNSTFYGLDICADVKLQHLQETEKFIRETSLAAVFATKPV